jgi:hypothetical protein
MTIIPNLTILPEAQKILWPFLKDTPKEFVLYGGTAISLRYGKRQSVDFDFFSTRDIVLEKINNISYLKKFNATLIQNIDRFYIYNVCINEPNDKINEVKISFIISNYTMPGCINAPDKSIDNKISIASPLDLMVGKIYALQERNTWRDFFDLGVLISNGVSLQKGFEAAYAIGKLLPDGGTSKLYLNNLYEDLKSNSPYDILSHQVEYANKIHESAVSLDMDSVYRTRLRPFRHLDISSSLGL